MGCESAAASDHTWLFYPFFYFFLFKAGVVRMHTCFYRERYNFVLTSHFGVVPLKKDKNQLHLSKLSQEEQKAMN